MQMRTLRRRVGEIDDRFKRYFAPIEELLNIDGSEQAVLSYTFARVERAQTQLLVQGLRREHKVNATLASNAVERAHLTRKGFRDKLRTIFGIELSDEMLNMCKAAEKVRDKLLHGKGVHDREVRDAIWRILTYYRQFAELTQEEMGIDVTTDNRGYAGRSRPHDENTSRWMLTGMGFFQGNRS